jgi:hypothetical protein
VIWGVGVLFGGGGSQAEVRGMGDTNTHGKSEKRGSEAFDYPVASRHNSVVPLLGPTCTVGGKSTAGLHFASADRWCDHR